MLATYRALCEYGYAETSIQRIADEFDKSKSLLYYHYEDKEALLADFLRFLLEQLRTGLESIPDDDPTEAMERILDALLPAPMEDEEFQFRKALVEIRSQAPYNDVYREQVARSDETIRAGLAATLERGIEDGVFHPVDPERTATFIYTSMVGATHRAVSLDDPDQVVRDREMLDDYLRESVYREE